MGYDRNWAGNYTYSAAECLVPESIEQVQELVARSNRIKVLGTRHSFNGIGDTKASHLSLERLNRVIALDRENHRVTVEGGIRYGELCGYLYENGYALHNLASLPHITIAGACATATHGSGDRNGNLATAVHAIEIVKGDGETIMFSRDQQDGELAGAVVGLGALGVVTKLTLNVVPSYRMAQHVYENLPLSKLEEHFEAIVSGGYSVSLFSDWKKPEFNQVWIKRLLTDPSLVHATPEYHGATLAGANMHPVPGYAADNCSEQLGIEGSWHERLPHFRMDFTPSAGEELQSEYFVAREDAYRALRGIERLRAHISPLLYVSEVRTIAADDLWMSPCYKQDSVAIHFTWKPDPAAVSRVLPMIEEELAPLGARPHWSKLFAMTAERLQPLYEKLPDFRELIRGCDPQGKFRNEYLERYILD
ncbi:FAD-binding protein [Paenibacillus sp. LHD-117]|uniref:FAD-binding protein n=1 Tax=Paenibacillus sp. LHD-117 TaxID=3071412 RepID=UPI0027E01754|nr:FAD-binding protein [Paenibacillus sp. LHD-117]MDQ6420574.1 FAD-binding protein [Paenibacillus sp. LHD-117]